MIFDIVPVVLIDSERLCREHTETERNCYLHSFHVQTSYDYTCTFECQRNVLDHTNEGKTTTDGRGRVHRRDGNKRHEIHVNGLHVHPDHGRIVKVVLL